MRCSCLVTGFACLHKSSTHVIGKDKELGHHGISLVSYVSYQVQPWLRQDYEG